MKAVLDSLNYLVTLLNAVNPAWYIVFVGPLANIVQHYLKKEQDFAESHHTLNEWLAVGIAAFAGAFYALIHTVQGASLASDVQAWLVSTALIGSPIYLVAKALFYGVSSKLEVTNALPIAGTLPKLAPATAALAPDPAVEAPAPTPEGV